MLTEDLSAGRDPDQLHGDPGEGPEHEAHQPGQQGPSVVTLTTDRCPASRGGHIVVHDGQCVWCN